MRIRAFMEAKKAHINQNKRIPNAFLRQKGTKITTYNIVLTGIKYTSVVIQR